MLYLRRIARIYGCIFLMFGVGGLASLMGTACGSGANQASHHDYLQHIQTARWEQPEVLYRVYGGPPAEFGREVRKIVRRGLGRWEDSLQGFIRLREAQGSEQENISVRFVKAGSLGGSFLGNQTLGRTTLTYKPGTSETVISSALVELDSQLWFRLPTLEVISSHEGGCHGLGVKGHSPYPSDVCYSAPNTAHPSTADTNTIRAIYGGQR